MHAKLELKLKAQRQIGSSELCFRREIEKDAKSLFLFTAQLSKLKAIYSAGHIVRKPQDILLKT